MSSDLQECVAATFGNGVSSGCIVNMGAQVTSVMCIEVCRFPGPCSHFSISWPAMHSLTLVFWYWYWWI